MVLEKEQHNNGGGNSSDGDWEARSEITNATNVEGIYTMMTWRKISCLYEEMDIHISPATTMQVQNIEQEDTTPEEQDDFDA